MIEVRELADALAADASFVVVAAFHASVSPHYRQAGVDAFTASADALALRRRQRAGHRTWVAVREGRVVGLCELRRPGHLSMLFVAPDAQSIGIGTRLLEHAAAHEATGAAMTVNAPPNAVAFFTRRGFVATGPEREKDGVRFSPMRRG